MSSDRLVHFAGLSALFGALAACWLWLASPASPSAYLLDPSHFALAAATLVAPVYAAFTLLRPRRERLERHVLAVFLAAMPFIYLWGALRNHDAGAVLVEAAGAVFYGAWALAGYRRSTLLLGLGIAAHGIGWDSWHHHADYIAPWYADVCLIIDVTFAIAVAAHERARQLTPMRTAAADSTLSSCAARGLRRPGRRRHGADPMVSTAPTRAGVSLR